MVYPRFLSLPDTERNPWLYRQEHVEYMYLYPGVSLIDPLETLVFADWCFVTSFNGVIKYTSPKDLLFPHLAIHGDLCPISMLVCRPPPGL